MISNKSLNTQYSILSTLLFLSTFYFLPSAFSQGTITGKVIDGASGLPFEYATVLVLNQDDSTQSGKMLDSTGRFNLGELSAGKYKLTVSFMGYHTISSDTLLITAEKPLVSLGILTLQPDELLFEATVITEEKPYMEMAIDKKVYNVEKDAFSKGGTATDALANIPSVTVDLDRNISLRGSSNVTIWIDGKPSTSTGAGRTATLDNIPAELIERVEVITNPSAKYDPDGTAGIINIILKKNTKPGYNASVNFTIGTFHKYNGGLNFSFRNRFMNFYASYNGQYNEFRNRSNSQRETPADSLRYLDQEASGINSRWGNSGKIGFDFYLNDKNTIGISASINQRNRTVRDTMQYDFLDSNRNIIDYNGRRVEELEDELSYDLNIYYTKLFKQQGKSLSFDLTYSKNNGEENMWATQRYYTNSSTPVVMPVTYQHTLNFDKNSILTGMIDYVQPFLTKHTLEMGAKIIARLVDSDFRNFRGDSTAVLLYDTTISNRFRYDEQVVAGYLNYKGQFGNFGLSAGIRLEQAFTTSRQITTAENYENNYFSFFPSAALAYKFKNGHEINLSYTRRINRPSIEGLNPFPDYDDPYNLTRGNPYLRPEYINSIEFNYFKAFKPLSLSATAYFRHTSGAFSRLRSLDTNGIITTTFQNLGSNMSYGMEFIISSSPLKFWKLMLTGNLYGTRLNATTIIPGLRSDQLGGSMRFTNGFKLPKSFDIQLAYSLMVPVFSPQARIKPMQSLDIAVQKSFFDNTLQLSLRLTDVFNTRRWAMSTFGEGFTQELYRKRESRILYFAVTYKFGNLKGDSKTRKTKDSGGSDMMEDGF